MTSTRRLVVDTLRRHAAWYAAAAVLLAALSWIRGRAAAEGEALGSRGDLLAYSLTAAWFLAFLPALVLEAREITQLPISRRDHWIARWWLAVVAPSVGIAVAVGLGSLVGGTSLAPLTPLFTVLYGGCFMALTAVFPLRVVAGAGLWPTIRILILVMGIPLGGAALPFWFAKYLPENINAINGPALGWIIAAAGMTVASYFNQPPIVERASRGSLSSSTSAKPFRGSRFVGLRLLFVKDARRAVITYGVLLLAGIAYWAIFGSTTLAAFLNGFGALVFAGLPSPAEGFPIVAIAFLMGASDIGLAGDLRGLRALPVSAARLSGIITGTSVITAVALWLVLLAAHAITIGTSPVSLRPELFVGATGSLAFWTAIRIAVPGDPMFKIFGLGLLAGGSSFVIGTLVDQPASVIYKVMLAGGAAAIVLSWLVVTVTLRRSHRIYKKPALPIAISS